MRAMGKYLGMSLAVIFWLAILIGGVVAQGNDPLPSWNDGPTKQSIIDFVTRVTEERGPDYVAPEDRIATFDNDGTNQHPEWKTTSRSSPFWRAT
jgi:hypothetical protein